MRYIYTVARYFFFEQYRLRAKPNSAPLVYVDHEFDERVPFAPERVSIYLDFIRIWVAAISHARRELGRASTDAIAAFIDGLSDSYLEAYRVYRRCASTTRRPTVAANGSFGLIYAVDPHLFCLPSLHVMIVSYTWLEIRRIYTALGEGERGRSAWEDLYRQAVSITDTVIYVKQHSVNCIPAALFMTTRMRSDFSRSDALAFIDELFLEPALPDRPSIVRYMRELYGRFMDEADRRALSEGSEAGDYGDVLVEFLLGYPRGAAVPQIDSHNAAPARSSSLEA